MSVCFCWCYSHESWIPSHGIFYVLCANGFHFSLLSLSFSFRSNGFWKFRLHFVREWSNVNTVNTVEFSKTVIIAKRKTFPNGIPNTRNAPLIKQHSSNSMALLLLLPLLILLSRHMFIHQWLHQFVSLCLSAHAVVPIAANLLYCTYVYC